MTHYDLRLNENKTEWIIFNGCDISENVTITVGAHNIAQSHWQSHSLHISEVLVLGSMLHLLLSLRLRICVKQRITI